MVPATVISICAAAVLSLLRFFAMGPELEFVWKVLTARIEHKTSITRDAEFAYGIEAVGMTRKMRWVARKNPQGHAWVFGSRAARGAQVQ